MFLTNQQNLLVRGGLHTVSVRREVWSLIVFSELDSRAGEVTMAVMTHR